MTEKTIREGSLEAPERHPLPWKDPEFYDEDALYAEMERVFDICHGCRRCFSLCNAFPTLFDAIDESDTMELDSVPREVYWQVVDHCYLCDLCFMTKCPYVPPHEFNLDFPHLMLRAKAVRFRRQGARFRDRLLTSTDEMGRIAGIPVVAQVVNAANRSRPVRDLLDKALGIHPDAPLPAFHSDSLYRRQGNHAPASVEPKPAGPTRGRVALYATCYGNWNAPQLGEDLMAVFEHNDIPVRLVGKEQCCGMPKLELGDFDTIEAHKNANIPVLAALVDEGWDLVAPVPSCVLMYKQELPLLFPDDPDVAKVRDAFYDPFEYLHIRHQHGLLRTDFRNPLGKVAWHAACHQRVQNIGQKTREVLSLVPETRVEVIERCSGHDGTYTVKSEFHETAMKIGRPVFRKVEQSGADHFGSDCPMAGAQIAHGVGRDGAQEHPITLLRRAYGI